MSMSYVNFNTLTNKIEYSKFSKEEIVY